MRYDVPPRRRSTGTAILVVFLMGFMFLVGLAVVGVGVLVFTRARAHEVRAVVQHDMALRQAEEARLRAEQVRAQVEAIHAQVAEATQDASAFPPQATPEVTLYAEPAETPATDSSIRIANREVTIRLDEEGKIQVDGTACGLPQLKEQLAKAGEGRENAIVVVVNADKRCLFEHVAGVLAVCKELNLPDVRVGALNN